MQVVRVWLGMLLNPFELAAVDPNATKISNFFVQLTTDGMFIALEMAGFFFMLAALSYMSAGVIGNERMRSFAIGALYAALAGLALALLSGTIALIVSNAANGAVSGGP